MIDNYIDDRYRYIIYVVRLDDRLILINDWLFDRNNRILIDRL